jgi:O-antigen/teichoic acid export membrane protein
MGRFLVGAVAVVFGLFVAGMIAVWLVNALLTGIFYLVVGAAVVGAGAYLYYRAKRALGPGTRARRRLDAASETYRMRNN